MQFLSLVAFSYRGSPATPLDACSKIETSLNDTIAIIIRNETNKECHVAKQVSNVVHLSVLLCRLKPAEREAWW